MVQEATWKAVVLIPKGGGYYHGIGLVEAVWKVATMILNCRFTASITLHGVLYGLWAGRGTGTAFLEAKMIQQLLSMREEVLCMIFLDLHNAYGALDRYICLKILEGYGVGTRDRHILWEYWDRLWMVACIGGYYRAELKGF